MNSDLAAQMAADRARLIALGWVLRSQAADEAALLELMRHAGIADRVALEALQAARAWCSVVRT